MTHAATLALGLAAIASLPSAGAEDLVYLDQSFDNTACLKPGLLKDSGRPDQPSGGWSGQGDAAFAVVGSPCRSKPHALRITRVNTLKRLVLFRNEPFPAKRNYKVSFWCHANNTGSMALFLHSNKTARGKATAGVCLYTLGRLRIYNPVLPGINKWVLTGQRAPLETWFRCQLRFDVFQKLYWLDMTTEAGETTTSEAFPIVSAQPTVALQFLNVPPPGNSVVIDDVKVTYESTTASTVSNRQDYAPKATLSNGELQAVIDGDPLTGVMLGGQTAPFHMELKTNSPVSMVRIYSGRQDGSSKLAACQVHGLNASGQVPELVSMEASKRGGQNHDYVEYEFPPEVLTSLDFKLHAQPKAAGVFVREIGVYSPVILPASILNAQFIRQVYGEFRLPVYEDQEVARLHLINCREDGNAHRIGLTLTERFAGKVIAPLRQLALPHGETRIPFKIRDLPNGSYIATVEDYSNDNVVGGRATFRRLLRLQHRVPFKKQARYEMTGKKMFFPDDHYLASSSNLRFRACSGRVVQAVKQTLKSADFTQLGSRVYFDERGKLNVLFRRLNRGWMREKTTRYFLATAADAEFTDWTIQPLSKTPAIPDQGRPPWDEPTPEAKPDWRAKRIGRSPIKLRFYDPARDGKVKLNQVAFRRITRAREGTVMRRTDLDWSAIKPLRGSTWPVWFKARGVGLVLRRESLLQDMPSLIGDLEDPKATNDNWAGQFLSDDGKALINIHANVLRRFRPFNAPWDNLAKCSRILTVYRTRDGINYTRTHMALPDESDPPASQHYGGLIRRAPGGNGLKLVYLARYRAYTQQIDTIISYSWDGIHWRRFSGQDILAANGPHGSWSAGHVWLGSSAVERDGKVYHLIQRLGGIYHFQSEIANSGTDESVKKITGPWIKDRFEPRSLHECPLFGKFGSWDRVAEHTRNTGVGVGVLVYRKDGLFCIEAQRGEGEFLTLPVSATGSLRTNALISKGGYIKIELTDVNGRALPNYSSPNAALLEAGDWLDEVLRFGSQNRLPQDPFRIRATMCDAKLFTLSPVQ